MGKVKLIAAIVILVVVLAVFLQNSDPVRFKFLFFAPIEIAKTLLILGSALLGSAATLLSQFFWRRRKRLGSPSVTQHSGLSPQD
jgi:uncharacterized integral membrane protein